MNIFPILALDVGKKRVGIAYMSSLSGKADYSSIVSRESGKALQAILDILKEKKVKTLLAGMPYGANGQTNEQCNDVSGFCRRIERRADIKVVYVDEYLSSVEASYLRKKGSNKIDDLAAEIILKRYLVQKKMLPELNY